MMNSKIKYCLIILMLVAVNVNADFEYTDKFVQINKIDLLAKTVYYKENGKSYNAKFSMELLEDVYFKSSTDKYNLSSLPLKKDYYMNLRSFIDKTNSKKAKEFVVYYIGTVPYPF